jgi:hypothetical protein
MAILFLAHHSDRIYHGGMKRLTSAASTQPSRTGEHKTMFAVRVTAAHKVILSNLIYDDADDIR